MVMSIWEYNGNGNKRLAGVGKGLKLMRMGRNRKAESHSRTPISATRPFTFHRRGSPAILVLSFFETNFHNQGHRDS